MNAFLEQFYHHGSTGDGIQGIVREFLEAPPDGVRLEWLQDGGGLMCKAHDGRGAYRIDIAREAGRWSARACSCLGFQEFRRECRHLRAVRQALAVRRGSFVAIDEPSANLPAKNRGTGEEGEAI
jgi:hypothetical protein